MKLLLSFLFLIFTSSSLFSSQETSLPITWNDLGDVRFIRKTNKNDGLEYLFPVFGSKVKQLEGKKIRIRGYVIPVDPQGRLLVLSAHPMASCFFCGGAGPASILQLKMSPSRRFRVDEIRTMTGTLRLNPDNVDELNYIMENASIAGSL